MPASVEVEQTGSDLDPDRISPAEETCLAGAVDRRRAEFITGRVCARRALCRLGHPPVPILLGQDGEPRWPEGIVGSITHCTGLRAAAVARAAALISLGIDAEPNVPLPDGVIEVVADHQERRSLAPLARADPSVAWDRLLFSAKESIYKAWYPVARRWLDFSQCRLTIGPGRFVGDLLVTGPQLGPSHLTRMTGRWAVVDDHLLTTAWLPLSDQRRGAR